MRIRVYLERVYLDRGGYVRKGQAIYHGTYYGIGAPLYRVFAEWEGPNGWESLEHEFRASDRASAIERVNRDMRASVPADARLVFSGRP